MTKRLELLIVPRDLIPRGREPELMRSLGETLDRPRCLRVSCGDHEVFVATEETAAPGKGGEVAGDAVDGTGDPTKTHSGLSITEGRWPEPLGLRLELSSPPGEAHWSVESDRYGVRPVYYGRDHARRAVISTRPEVVGAIINSRLSAPSVAEHLLVGFNLDDHAPFEGVHRLRPQERLAGDATEPFRLVQSTVYSTADRGEDEWHVDVPEWVTVIGPQIAEAFEQGFALELSGGVDSRLVLAIGVQNGAKPKVAFTLGEADDEDVRIARHLCVRHCIEHITVPAHADPELLVANGRRFAARSGFATNASSFSWLPSAFARLASHRTAQLGGGGGECAAGFYYSPLDVGCRSRAARQVWIRSRLFRSPSDLAGIMDASASRWLMLRTIDTADRLLAARTGSWRQRTDEFYLTQRVPNAGGPVLSASACWYEPFQPLLSAPYIEWGRTLAPGQRAERREQMALLLKIHRGMATIPYSHGRRLARGTRATIEHRVRRFARATQKIHRRLHHRPGPPDLGAIGATETLANDPTVRACLGRLVDSDDIPLDRAAVDAMIQNPSSAEHELGALITAAWAREGLEAQKRLWQSDSVEEPIQCVA